MNKNKKSHFIASLGTVLVMVLLFLLLWFVSFYTEKEPEDEGICVSFGDADLGGGVQDGLLASAAVPETMAPPPAASAPSDNDLMTQEDEETLALRRQQEEAKKRQNALDAERRRKEKAEQERLEAERIAKEKALAEQRAKEQAAIDKASQLGALFGNTTSTEGANGNSNQSASSSTKGNPAGHGNSGGNSWSLSGRSLKGALPQPAATFNQEGKVVVSIIVDASGKVVSARVGNGTTISDEATRQLAVKAALKAVFNDVERPDKAFGTITYNFKFK